LLLDERDVPPGVGRELAGVVVRVPAPDGSVCGNEVPLLARDLAGLAPDADRGVREEADAFLLLVGVRLPAVGLRGQLEEVHEVFLASSGSTRGSASRRECACSRSSATKRGSSGPRGRRPGWIPHVNAFTSWMWTFGSSAMCERSFAESPVTRPRLPQW